LTRTKGKYIEKDKDKDKDKDKEKDRNMYADMDKY
jgi:hypothetical protein